MNVRLHHLIIIITLIGIVNFGCGKVDNSSTLLTITGASDSAMASKKSSKKEDKDWYQFLGPNRNGTSAEKDILKTWPKEGPEVLWTADVQKGYGGAVPIVPHEDEENRWINRRVEFYLLK